MTQDTNTASGAANLLEALIGAIMGAAYDFRDAHISGGPNQKRSAHAALESAVTHALRASHGQAPAQPDPAYSEACNLATALFKKHFAHLPDYASGQVVWGLFDSTEGVILQIDNMVSGLVQPPTTSPQADSVQEDAARLDWLLLRVSGAEFRRIGVHYSGNARRADVDAARKQGENHDNS